MYVYIYIYTHVYIYTCIHAYMQKRKRTFHLPGADSDGLLEIAWSQPVAFAEGATGMDG
jgi:hypothetical protein